MIHNETLNRAFEMKEHEISEQEAAQDQQSLMGNNEQNELSKDACGADGKIEDSANNCPESLDHPIGTIQENVEVDVKEVNGLVLSFENQKLKEHEEGMEIEDFIVSQDNTGDLIVEEVREKDEEVMAKYRL